MPASRPFLRTAGADVSARKPYDVISEPAGPDYAALLSAAVGQCRTGVLVFKTPLRGPAARELMECLEDQGATEVTLPVGALVRFTFNRDTAHALGDAVDRLYGWRSPELPEDLSLFREDGSPWLVTVSAERLGYVEVTPFEKLLLGRKAPNLPGALAHQGTRDAVLAVFERRLEAVLDGLSAQLVDHARALMEEGRDGLVEALGQWLDSGEPSRVATALDVIGALGLDELTGEVAALAERSAGGETAIPPVFRTSAVLGRRWSEMTKLRVDRVLAALGSHDPEPL